MAGLSANSQASEDVQVRRVVWEGSIPLRIELEAKEVTTLTPPPPLFLMAPRLGYLPLLVTKIGPHFRAALPPGTDAVWFEYRGLPLRWHIPTGVLFDLLSEERTLPWRLTVHFRTYPSDLLIPIEGEETVKWSYMNALKEAVYIMHGSTKLVMGLSQRDQEELWRSVSESDFDAHEKSSASLGPSPATSSRPRSVPLRLYLRQAGESGATVGKWDEVAFTTRCADVIENGSLATLGGALHKALPQLFDEGSSNSLPVPTMTLDRRMSSLDIEPSTSRRNSITGEASDSPRDSSRRQSTGETSREILPSPGLSEEGQTSGATDAGGEKAEVGTECGTPRGDEVVGGNGDSLGGSGPRSNPSERKFAKGLVVRIQGTEPRWDVPLDWLSRNLCHPDRFLHVCVWRRAQSDE